MIKRTFVLFLVMALASSSAFAGPAQDILGSLAESAREERVISSLITIGIGVGVGIGGYYLLDDLGLATVAAITGGLIALPGLITLAIPSEAELACSRACDSEANSALALESMAANARLARTISGIVNVAAGTASLLFPYRYVTQYDYVYSAIVSFGMAAVDFLFPSTEERAYKSYQLLVAPNG